MTVATTVKNILDLLNARDKAHKAVLRSREATEKANDAFDVAIARARDANAANNAADVAIAEYAKAQGCFGYGDPDDAANRAFNAHLEGKKQ
jgi:hypothetical protein